MRMRSDIWIATIGLVAVVAASIKWPLLGISLAVGAAAYLLRPFLRRMTWVRELAGEEQHGKAVMARLVRSLFARGR